MYFEEDYSVGEYKEAGGEEFGRLFQSDCVSYVEECVKCAVCFVSIYYFFN